MFERGIVTYAMVIGKLPFTTPYTDQYRRQKLLQQVEKGISEPQLKEMCHLSEGERERDRVQGTSRRSHTLCLAGSISIHILYIPVYQDSTLI